jgi:hypothetical protein
LYNESVQKRFTRTLLDVGAQMRIWRADEVPGRRSREGKPGGGQVEEVTKAGETEAMRIARRRWPAVALEKAPRRLGETWASVCVAEASLSPIELEVIRDKF